MFTLVKLYACLLFSVHVYFQLHSLHMHVLKRRILEEKEGQKCAKSFTQSALPRVFYKIRVLRRAEDVPIKLRGHKCSRLD